MLHDAVDNVGLVDGEALLLVEVAVDDALADGFLHDGGRVEAVGRERAGAAALVEEAALIGLVELGFGFGFRHRGLGGVVWWLLGDALEMRLYGLEELGETPLTQVRDRDLDFFWRC